MKLIQQFKINALQAFKTKVLLHLEKIEIFCFLDHNNYPSYPYHQHDLIVAIDAIDTLEMNNANCFESLKKFRKKHKNQYLFGTLSYDLKNQLENLESNNLDIIDWPDLLFFVPRWLIKVKSSEVKIYGNAPLPFDIQETFDFKINKENYLANIKHRISKDQYLSKIHALQKEILKGNIYEVNFCMEFFQENQQLKPLETFSVLNKNTKAPFAAYFKVNHLHLLSASPERFLKKNNNQVIAQPIKGTIARDQDPIKDKALQIQLKDSLKEQSENIMIVDLVRNDLSRIDKVKNVNVEALNKVYSFETVHQLISTITAECDQDIDPIEIIRACFPMGSMTGAPKISAMQLIEKFEKSKRGIYSGSVVCIQPNGDFDSNVVIRSIIYNEENKNTSIHTGSAITALSVPKDEYNECLLKAKALFKSLQY